MADTATVRIMIWTANILRRLLQVASNRARRLKTNEVDSAPVRVSKTLQYSLATIVTASLTKSGLNTSLLIWGVSLSVALGNSGYFM